MAPVLGKVYLVGAGPGDPGLLTLRGKACLEAADVVIYDALVNPALLEFAAAAEHVFAGKQRDSHSLPQEEISRFEELTSGLAAQTMMALGMMTEPDQKEIMVDLPSAKHLIDTLTMLKEKTQGNLTSQEEGTLTKIVSDLQRAFVVRSQQVQESALKGATRDLSKGHTK